MPRTVKSSRQASVEIIERPTGPRGRPAPRYFAVEAANESGTFLCETRGPGVWSAEQLKGWADDLAVELVLIRWRQGAGDD